MTMKTLRRFIATNEILMTATVTARVVGNVEGPDDSSPTDFSFITFHEFLFDEFLSVFSNDILSWQLSEEVRCPILLQSGGSVCMHRM